MNRGDPFSEGALPYSLLALPALHTQGAPIARPEGAPTARPEGHLRHNGAGGSGG